MGRWLASRFDARRLVFVDESGFRTSMTTRLYARAPRGGRAYGKVPRNRGKNTTLIAAIALEGGMGESVAVEGATDAEVFEAYVEHFLAPSLKAGQVVVVLDRLGAHRTGKLRESSSKLRGPSSSVLAFLLLAGAEPHRGGLQQDQGPRVVRKAGARTREALVEAIERALAAVTSEEAVGWFAHAGYEPQDQPL